MRIRQNAANGPAVRGELRPVQRGTRGPERTPRSLGVRRMERSEPRPAGGLGRRGVRTSRPAGAAAPWPERVAGPLFGRIFLQTIVLKCLK
jgi:hypothetical protein